MSRILESVVGLLAFCLVVSLVGGRTVAQSFDVSFEQLAKQGGDLEYEMTLPRIFGRPTASVRWTGPAGSGLVSDGRQPTFMEEDFATLSSKVFGTWELDLLEFAGMPAEHFEFTIVSFSLDTVFHELSTITSPTPGSVVPTVFNLSWDYPNAERPSGRSVRWSNSSSGIDITGAFADGIEPLYEVTATFEPGLSSGQATFRAGSYNRDPTQVTGDVVFLQRFTPHTSFSNLSAPATYHLQIPEPTSLVLASLVGLVGLGLLHQNLGIRRAVG